MSLATTGDAPRGKSAGRMRFATTRGGSRTVCGRGVSWVALGLGVRLGPVVPPGPQVQVEVLVMAATVAQLGLLARLEAPALAGTLALAARPWVRVRGLESRFWTLESRV